MTQFLVMLALLGSYGLFVLVSPTKACGACQRRRGRPCPRCQGTGRQFRPGARLVHRGAVKARQQARERRRRG
jgi:hypothetical protein